MEDSKPNPGYWALLVGINFYINPTEHLEGCVRDVENIKAYLENCPFSIQTRTFTATVPADPTSNCPSESKGSWPTYENITNALQHITDTAAAGDFVYIHYSGHGAQTLPNAAYSNHETGDLALVLFYENFGRRYFRGVDFAQRVNRMVEKGLTVNIVLDCCFSASVVRKGSVGNTRATRHAHAIDKPGEPGSLPQPADVGVPFNKIGRDGFAVPKWLINPDGYTILTACGSDEVAMELGLGHDGLKTGALTHFLLLALTSLHRSGVEISQQSLHSYLLVQFQLHRPSQNPVLYGNRTLSFFGKLLPVDTLSVSVIWRDHQLLLEAGEAHGVCKGDKYMLSAFECPETGPDQTTVGSVSVFVDAVGSLTSVLAPTPDQDDVETGWKAHLVTPFSLKETTVRFVPEISNEKYSMGVEKATRSLQLLAVNDQPLPWLYTVITNDSGDYEIRDQKNQPLSGLQVISENGQDSVEAVMGTLNHISRFKSIEAIENRIANSTFMRRFTIRMEGPDGDIHEGIGVLNVRESERVKLVIQNHGSTVLYAYVYNLSSSWGIKNIFSGASHWSIPPKNNKKGHQGMEQGEFEMFVPDHFKKRNYLRCRDVFKIFLTTRPIPFTSLEMPALCGPDSKRTDTIRGDHSDVLDLLLGIQPTLRGSEAKALIEEWTSHNFVVCTVYDKKSS